MLQVVWFKRDLRVNNHRPLCAAALAGPVLPLYILEPALWQQPDVSARHWRVLRPCLLTLAADLAGLGQELIVRRGDVVGILADIRARLGPFALWSHEETGALWTYRRDQAVLAWCRAEGIPWRELPQTGVVRRLKSRSGWAAQWDRRMAEPLVPPPAGLPPLASRGFHLTSEPLPEQMGAAIGPATGDGEPPGDRATGLYLLESFVQRRAARYVRGLSSPLTAPQACSRLSPALALGTLSMAEVVQRLRMVQRQTEVGDSWAEAPGVAPNRALKGGLHACLSRLAWHCHFIQKLEDQPSIETKCLHPALEGLRGTDPARIAAWAKGETGIPFIDACMRALVATGWINFRMRAMLCSFAAYQLWQDWRAPARHLARCFIDYEPGIHYPQVQMQSGTTGINTLRIYNPVKQGLDHDPDGVFLRTWLPELADLPTPLLHEPWKAETPLLRAAGVRLDGTYPRPIVDSTEAARFARETLWPLRRGRAVRQAAAAVVEKHGSRKASAPPTREAARRAAVDTRQGTLFED